MEKFWISSKNNFGTYITSLNHYNRFGFSFLILKNIIKYFIFTGLVVVALWQKVSLERLTHLQGLDTQLVGSLVVFLLIDIPLTFNREKKKYDERQKAQLIIDYALFPMLTNFLRIYLYYIYFPSVELLKNSYKFEELEQKLGEMSSRDFIGFYLNVEYKVSLTEFKSGQKKEVESMSFVNDLPRDSRYNLEAGYKLKNYNAFFNVFSLEESRDIDLSFTTLIVSLEKCTLELKDFLKDYSKIISVEEVTEVTKLILKIQEVVKNYKHTKESSYSIKLTRLLFELFGSIKYYLKVSNILSGNSLGAGEDINILEGISNMSSSLHIISTEEKTLKRDELLISPSL